MQEKNIESAITRVRFAPAPTGMMHLGNIRAALFNYLFARQQKGTVVLRIEDTDAERNYDPNAQQIIADLAWLGLGFDEGPGKGGPYGPYFQSERTAMYQEALNTLIKDKKVYRCFCTVEELEKKRQRQQALKTPPRYDKTCLKLTEQEIEAKLAATIPFIWRLNIQPNEKVSFTDLAKGTLTFDTSNLTDFPLTRQDGSFTFLFANCVDDIKMKISHVFRGEDHLTNTANQLLLYKAFNAQIPIFFHLPIICNVEGKKLSKRDFGFSIKDLQDGGYLPQAICNYLAILGSSFEEEIMSLNTLITDYNFNNLPTASQIRYDVQKLNWINHKWIAQLTNEELAAACRPILCKENPIFCSLDNSTLISLIELIKTDLTTLNDCVGALKFYGEHPVITQEDIAIIKDLPTYKKQLAELFTKHRTLITNPIEWLDALKKDCKLQNIPLKLLFHIIRLAFIGKTEGPALQGIIEVLKPEDRKKRIDWLLDLLEK